MKKAQTEIIGLLVIVVLLIVLAFIFIRLGFRQEPSFMPGSRESTVANNLLLAVIRTNMPQGRMDDFIVESYLKEDYTYLEGQIKSILSKSLPNKNYQFLLNVNEELVFQIGEECKEAIAATQSFSKNNNAYKLILKIC